MTALALKLIGMLIDVVFKTAKDKKQAMDQLEGIKKVQQSRYLENSDLADDLEDLMENKNEV